MCVVTHIPKKEVESCLEDVEIRIGVVRLKLLSDHCKTLVIALEGQQTSYPGGRR